MTTVLLFASARLAVGSARFDTDAATVGEIVAEVVRRGGSDMQLLMPHCSVMVDAVRVDDENTAVFAESEVAILPPFSGG